METINPDSTSNQLKKRGGGWGDGPHRISLTGSNNGFSGRGKTPEL